VTKKRRNPRSLNEGQLSLNLQFPDASSLEKEGKEEIPHASLVSVQIIEEGDIYSHVSTLDSSGESSKAVRTAADSEVLQKNSDSQQEPVSVAGNDKADSSLAVRSSEPIEQLIDLSRQQRNLLLMRPVFEFELNKNSFQSVDHNRQLMASIDTHYFILNLFDFLMEGVAIGNGRNATQIIDHLAIIATAMDADLSEPDCRRIAEHTLSYLLNKRDGCCAFSYEYFDAITARRKKYDFKLVEFAPDFDDEYMYKPTEEGYLVYLGMLDLAPEDASELMEKMLDLLIKRNKFAEAIDIARRARTLSIEFRQLIRDTITRAKRMPRNVNWDRDIEPRLERARSHVTERRKQDGTMLNAVRKDLTRAEDFTVRENIVKLLELLQNSGTLRANLLFEIMGAADEYLTAQERVFRVRAPSNLPGLEETVFPSVLDAPIMQLAANADEIIASNYPTKFPHLFELNSVFTLLLEKRAKTEPISDDRNAKIIPSEVFKTMFSSEEIAEAENWTTELISEISQIGVEDLILKAESNGKSKRVIQCIALYLYIVHHESERSSKLMDIVFESGFFKTKYIQGSPLLLRQSKDR